MDAITAPRPRRSRSLGWLDERLGLSGISYPVPRHANALAYTLGGITLVSFVLLVGATTRVAEHVGMWAPHGPEWIGFGIGVGLMLVAGVALKRQ